MQRRAKISTKPLQTSEMMELNGVEGLLVYGMLMKAGEKDKAARMLKDFGVRLPCYVEIPKDFLTAVDKLNLMDGIDYFRGEDEVQENGKAPV